jgi:hypothetical protein
LIWWYGATLDCAMSQRTSTGTASGTRRRVSPIASAEAGPVASFGKQSLPTRFPAMMSASESAGNASQINTHSLKASGLTDRSAKKSPRERWRTTKPFSGNAVALRLLADQLGRGFAMEERISDQIVIRVKPSLRARLEHEAERVGLELSALARLKLEVPVQLTQREAA